MRVGVYVPEVEPAAGGAHTFLASVLDALERAGGGHELVLLCRDERPPPGGAGLARVRLAPPDSPLETSLDDAVHVERLEMVWFPTPDWEPVTVPFVATVWDLEHRNQPYFPEVSVSGWDWEEREFFYRSTLPRAALVLTGTKEGRRQIRDYYGVREERIAIAPFPTPGFSPAELEPLDLAAAVGPLPDPYVFYPAQYWPHKNHVALLLALRHLAEQGLRVGAVFTGSDKGNLAHVEATVAELGLAEQVRFLGFVDRRTLVALYRGALALAFPSFFGPDNLPPLEAFALGCPVLAAAVPGVEERLGDAALYFDPRKESELAVAVRRLFDEPDLPGNLRQRGIAHGRRWTAADYVAAVNAALDALESIRRCWSRREPYRHT